MPLFGLLDRDEISSVTKWIFIMHDCLGRVLIPVLIIPLSSVYAISRTYFYRLGGQKRNDTNIGWLHEQK
jgi:hypothetical protein